ncbi:MAG: hypothetical protein U0359_07660 [Byssovorax sp.]
MPRPRRTSLPPSLAASSLTLAGLLTLGLHGAACSDGGTGGSSGTTSGTTSTNTTSGTGGSTGTGGTGGAGGMMPPAGQVCAQSPVAAPFAGTDDCPAPMPAAKDTFDAALEAGGLDRCHVRLLPEDVALSGWPAEMLVDKRRLPDFTPLQRGPLRLPAYARETRGWLDAALASKNPVSDTIAALSVRRGHAFDETCADLSAFEPKDGDATPLATALLLLDSHQGMLGDETATRAAAAPIPLALQEKLSRVLGALDHAASEVKEALGTKNATDLRYFARSHALYVPSFVAFSTTAASIAKLDTVDLDRITLASALLARTIESQDLGAVPDATFPPFEIKTPLGNVVIHDSSNDTYKKGDAAEVPVLLFDLGGDDTYEVPAGASDDKRPVSVAIDVRGADHYGYAIIPDTKDGDLLPSDGKGRYHSSKTPDMDYGPITISRIARQGAGLAGIGMLWDLGKDSDSYQSLAISQGFASMGVGILYDEGGDDTYKAEVGAQGAATFGIGALIDGGGKDTYQSFSYSQGFGGAKGAGALVDAGGDDIYFCDPGSPTLGGHPLYFTPQLPGKGNSSMSQGAAMGRRPQAADDAAYMAGGIGILHDKAGSDKYTGSVFAQGVGYWQGIGMLVDSAGDDTYNALWYIQGSTAHFSLSVFLEEGGNDSYNPDFVPAATSIGLGHDFSASVHLDEGGDDYYRAPGLSLGSGNINGIGCLVNSGGNDTYEVAGDPTLGAGNYSSEAMFGMDRQNAPTIGIFVDVGGADQYTVGGESRALDDTTWSYEPQPYPPPQMVETEHGCSADDGSGSAVLP